MTEEIFNGAFGRLRPGCARLSYNGKIAIKTKNGYKTYNLQKGMLVKCGGFVIPQSDDLFFIMPTCKVKPGDIIIANGLPKCVVSASANELKCVNYENAVMETVLPERHIFMGKTYFYGKIVSLYSGMFKNGNGAGKMMKLMMLTSLMNGNNKVKLPSPFANGDDSAVETTNGGGIGSMLPMMMLMGGGKDLFDGMLDFGLDSDDGEDILGDDEDDEDEDDEEETVVEPPAKTSKKKSSKK